MKKKIPGYRARRWVVERTHSWLNRFRRLLIRWDKKLENYLALLHLACAWITFRLEFQRCLKKASLDSEKAYGLKNYNTKMVLLMTKILIYNIGI